MTSASSSSSRRPSDVPRHQSGWERSVVMAEGVEENAEWAGRLEGLRSQHRREMINQQEAHLRQLQALQTQLLQELSPSLLTGDELQTHRHHQVDGSTSPTHSPPGTSSQDHASLHDTSDLVPSLNQSLEFLALPPAPCPLGVPDGSPPGAEDQSTSPPDTEQPHTSSPQPIQPTAFHTPTTQANQAQASHQVSHSAELSTEPKPVKPVCPVSTYLYTPSLPTRSLSLPRRPLTSPVTCAGYLMSSTPPLATQAPPTMLHQQVGGYRATLIEKHNKHVEDLRTFYEAELAALRRELGRKREELFPVSSSPREGPRVDSRGPWGEDELRGEMEDAKMQSRMLEAEVGRLHDRVGEWQVRYEASEHLTLALRESLDSARTQLHQEKHQLEMLQSELQSGQDEVQFWKEQRTRLVEKMEQLFGEFEEVQKENKDLQLRSSSLEEELGETRREVASLRAAVSKLQSQENQYRSAIHRLEEETRRLQHENNRLHSQATHHGLGYHTPYNEADEDKLHYSSPMPLGTPSRQTSSPNPTTYSSLHSKPAVTSRGESPSPALPSLTRKKWLEPSDPGLISGTPVATPPARPRTSPTGQPSLSSERGDKEPVESSPVLQVEKRSSPRQGEEERGREMMADSALQAVRSGSVWSGNGHETYRKHSGPPSKHKVEKSVEDRVREHMEIVSTAEERLTKLQSEKDRLESALQRVPRTGGGLTHQVKQNQLAMEHRLEEVVREIGSTRMVLRSHHALGKS